MKSYLLEVYNYTKYFHKVMFENKINYVYKIMFPVFFIIFNSWGASEQATFHTVIIWISYMIFMAGISINMDLATLREQGYLKQYHSLVSHHTVFLVAKFFVELAFLLLSITMTLLVLIVLNPLSFQALVWLGFVAILVAVIMILPVTALMSFILLLDLNTKSLTTLSGVLVLLTIGLLYLSNFEWGIASWVNPIYLTNHLMAGLFQGSLPSLTFFWPLLIYLTIGIYSYSQMPILPRGD